MTGTVSTGVSGAELLLDALIDEGVTHFFNNPGLGHWGIVDRLAGSPIEYVMALHEASLVSMADGFARGSGRPSVASVYMMPGTANAMSALYIARQDRTPLVLASTQQMRSMTGRDPYASIDEYLTMAGSVTKWAHEVTSPERLPEAIHRAFAIAMTPPKGPVFLAIPYELFPATAAGPPTGPLGPSAVPRLGGLDPGACELLVERLVSAERPALIVGKDVIERDAVDQVVALAELVGAPVMHEEWTMTVAFPNRHRLSVGNATEGGTPKLLERLGTDFVLNIGGRVFPEVSAPIGALPEGMDVAAISECPRDLGRSVALTSASIADARIAVEQLLAAYPRTGLEEKTARRLSIVGEVREENERARRDLISDAAGEGSRMRPVRLFEELDKAMTDDTLLVEHATTNFASLYAAVDVARPENVFGTASSNQGWGLPAAVGLQLARPGQPVVAVVGDGGFSFTPQVLWTAARRNIPVTAIVLNNRGYNATRWGSALFPRIVEAGQEADFDFWFDVDASKIASGFGVKAARVSDPHDAGDAIRAALGSDEPNVIEVLVGD